MKLIITNHVNERRKNLNKQPIEKKYLNILMKYLIDQHNFQDKKDGTYKFRAGGTQAVMAKKNNQCILITLFGPLSPIQKEEYDLEFNCIYQTDELIKRKKEAAKKREERKLLKKGIQTPSAISRNRLKNLQSKFKKQVKQGSLLVTELTNDEKMFYFDKFGKQPFFLAKYKEFNPLTFLLKFNGGLISVIQTKKEKNEIS